jgi:hypothetical protein
MFNAAFKSYERKTKEDLTEHSLLPSLQSCDSPEAILTVLREQIPAAFNQSQNGDDRLTKWVSPTVNVLYAFSATVGQGVGLVRIEIFCRGEFSALTYTFRHSHRQMQSLRGLAFSSWSVSFICRLRKLFWHQDSQAAKDASTSQEKIFEIFNRIEHFFRRLEIYTVLTPTAAMTDMIVEIVVEVLTILAIVTKEVKRGPLSEFISRLFTPLDWQVN